MTERSPELSWSSYQDPYDEDYGRYDMTVVGTVIIVSQSSFPSHSESGNPSSSSMSGW